MTFDEIMAIIRDKSRTDFQQAADIHAAWAKATHPSALNIKPQKQRKARTATTKPKSPASEAANGFAGHVDNEGGVQ